MNDPVVRTCETCVAWKEPWAWQDRHDPKFKNHYWKGECRMNVPSCHGAASNQCYWPQTEPTDWCMQWAENREAVHAKLKNLLVEGT